MAVGEMKGLRVLRASDYQRRRMAQMSAATSKKGIVRSSWDRIASHSVDNGLSLIHHNVITTPGSVQVVRGGGCRRRVWRREEQGCPCNGEGLVHLIT